MSKKTKKPKYRTLSVLVRADIADALEAEAAAAGVPVPDFHRGILAFWLAPAGEDTVQPEAIARTRLHDEAADFRVWLIHDRALAERAATTAASLIRRAARDIGRELLKLTLKQLAAWADSAPEPYVQRNRRHAVKRFTEFRAQRS